MTKPKSIYAERGRRLKGASAFDPYTVETRSLETVDNDQLFLFETSGRLSLT